KQKGEAQTRKKKDPKECFANAKYVNDAGQECGRAVWFKKAMVNAVGFAKGMKKTNVNGTCFILGELLPLEYQKVVNRQDMVRVGPWSNRTAD
ncbi:hypothetical protein, partial [Staphylococcus aureus]|uniref:hypothetical protein n=1 Tax=Staphylococcus aureus TaxID=1280 RepID=UPI0039BE47CF